MLCLNLACPAPPPAAAGQLAGHSAAAGLPPVLGAGYGEAAWVTMASLFTLAASFSERIIFSLSTLP